MSDESTKLTAATASNRQDAKRLQFAAGRYSTRGNPRTGGIASVYQATDVDTGDTVALKVFRTGGTTDGVIEESFRREVQALSDLNHPNIVRILDSGRDEENAVHFIAMEWIEQDLNTICRSRSFGSWSDFFSVIGKGVLEALVFAHSRSTVHRDIKPSNILVMTDGRPKLCDFGISKIRKFLVPGVTLAQFASAPFSPPEPDDGSYSYSRDVFGFAALSVAALSKEQPQSHKDLLVALEAAPIDEPLRRLLRRCLSLDSPESRPQNAVLLLADLRKLMPVAATPPRGTVLINLTNRVRDILYYDMAIRGEQAERFIESDLDCCFCEEVVATTERPGRSVRLFGHKYGYAAALDESGGKLILVSALEYSPSDMEKKRAFACPVNYRLGITGASGPESTDALEGIFEQLLEFAADQKQRKLEQREQALYKTWLDLLSAKTELEKKRKSRAPYQKVETSGGFVRLILNDGVDAGDFADQDVTIKLSDFESFRGTVVSIAEASILISPSDRNEIPASALSGRGVVEVDTTKSDVALDKQKAALEAVRYGRSINPDLGRHIVNPDTVAVPPSVSVEFIQRKIDDDKKDAVLAALAGPSLMVVQGPPGTGKTTFITELVLQTLKANPNARVLLTSQTHVALDNSLERIVSHPDTPIRALRIGNENDDRISSSTRHLLLDAQLPVMRKTALASGRSFIEKWAVEQGLSLKEIRHAMALERHAVLKSRIEDVEMGLSLLEPQLMEQARNALGAEERAELEEQFQGFTKERDDLIKELKESLKELGQYIESKEELKEFAECSAADLREWADIYANKSAAGTQVKKMLLAHAEWEARFGRSREFIAALVASSQVVAGTCLGVMSVPGRNEIAYDLCIVDEASIATPTEVLVPMARARRTILVGDRKQLSPFQDPELQTSGLLERYGLTVEQQKATLFNHLSDSLPTALHKELTTQHRMIPALGDLVSNCFYDGKLKSEYRDSLPWLTPLLTRPVTWFSTSRKAGRASKKIGTSCSNDFEVEYTVGLLRRFDFLIRNGRPKGTPISVAALTGYSEQRKRLRSAIETRRHEWISYSDIFVNVVDAFQGREADLVIFSVTRSEVQGLGFLREMERINVALSRAREMLVIVGDHVYCQMAPGATNPLRDVIDYIRRNETVCALEELPE